MALAVTVRYDFVDEKNKTSFTKIRVPTGFSIAQYVEFGIAMAQFVANISSCTITGGSITFGIDLSGLGLKTAANSLADIAQKAYFAFNSAVTGFKKRLRIPTFDEAKVNAGTDSIDTVDAAVAAFTTAMTNGIVVTGGTIQPSTERGQDLTSLSEAREVFRRHRG